MASRSGRSWLTEAFKVFQHNRSLPLLFAWTAVLAVVWALLAGQSSNYGVGRPPTGEEVRAWDIAIGPAEIHTMKDTHIQRETQIH